MKKAKILLPLLVSPIGVISPIALSSCSSDSNAMKDINYGDSYEMKSGKEGDTKDWAMRNLNAYPEQRTISEAQWDTILYNRQTQWISRGADYTETDPHTFYWELMYYFANTNQYLKLNSWQVKYDSTKAANKYTISLNVQVGTKKDKKVKYGDPIDITDAPLPTYEVHDGKACICFNYNNGQFAYNMPTFTYSLLTIQQTEK